MHAVALDVRVLLFALAVTLGSALFFGLFPALGVLGQGLVNILRRQGRSIAGGGSSRRIRGGLVVLEVTLAMVLLVGSGLLVRSFAALHAATPGIESHGRLLFSARLPDLRYPSGDSNRTFAERVLKRLASIPGVQTAAVSSLVPSNGFSDEVSTLYFEGRPEPPPGEEVGALHYRSSQEFFETLGIPLLAGRTFDSRDRHGSPLVTVVSEGFVQTYLPDQNPLGVRMRDGRDGEPMEIVGVVADVEHYGLGQPSLTQYYTPYAQNPSNIVSFVVQASVPPETLLETVRHEVGVVDPDLPLVGLRTMRKALWEAISLPRFRTALMTAFGAVALMLAAVGLYGVLSYTVALRTREIGIRVALGADKGSVLALVLREGTTLVLTGVTLGLLGSAALSRILDSMLYGVGSWDPTIFASVPVILTLVAGAAMMVPALRAARVNPARTLAEE
jgi:putative ABC transport system permease protein